MVTVKKHSRKLSSGKLTTVRQHYRRKCEKAYIVKHKKTKLDYSERDKVINKPYDQWLDEQGGIEALLDNMDGCSLEEMAFTLRNLGYSVANLEEQKTELKKDSEKFFEKRYNLWIKKYKEVEFPMNVYRGILSEDIDFDNLGIYWTDMQYRAIPYDGTSGRLNVIGAEVLPQDIEWEDTLLANMHLYLGKREQEFRLKKGVKVRVLSLLDVEDEKIILRDVEGTT